MANPPLAPAPTPRPGVTNGPERRVLLTEATPGMVLSRTLESPTRTRLCPSGTVLTDDLIKRLEGRGIKRLWVQGVPDPTQAAKVWADTSRRLGERFARVRAEPYMAEIERLVGNALAKRA